MTTSASSEVVRTSSLNTLSEHYDDYFASEQQLAWYDVSAIDKSHNIMRLAGDVAHACILDVGAGNGSVLQKLDQADFGSRLCAVDISHSGLREIRSKTWKHLDSVSHFDGYSLPFANQSFDLVLLSHVIEHVEHPRILLREAARVGRYVYIEVPLEYRWTNRRLRRDFELDATGHINFYNPTLIRLLVQSAGLRVLKQAILHFIPDVYTFQKGWRGLLNYWIKHVAYSVHPRMAAVVFNYHCGLLCTGAVGPSATHGSPPRASTSSSPSESAYQPTPTG